MTNPAFIAGDWGTSRLRLYLCDASGAVLARDEGAGAASADHAARFAAAVAAWDGAYGKLPAVLGGMVGSTIGWKEVPYLTCPARPHSIAAAALRFSHDGRAIAIAPGLTCTNPAGAPDVMRGEEVQILGALRLKPELARGRHIVCLPGTHTKWAVVEEGSVIQFQTALSGELFQLLAAHSVLARGGGTPDGTSAAFAQGIGFARTNTGGLLHALFSTRSRVVTGQIAKSEAASYLSGLILGADVAGATALFGVAGAVWLVCTPQLASLYDAALQAFNLSGQVIDGDDAALAGLVQIQAELT
ncbi:MAG TPA: 2-dehydro-3-deoxygalactonokinase [Rhizomicrobium sp.]|jgi:2-dehydro-3-deoxygalactonokinase|nr:2-dehydro-3-deoxygalactonokinase [Rhizomicrobium sp.]